MNTLKSLENRLRGWVPKDTNLLTRQQTASPKANGYKLKMGVSIFGTLAIVLGIQGALSPAFAPERSWSLYLSATGVIIGVAFIILLVRILQTRTARGLKGEFNSERQLRGWVPKEPSVPNSRIKMAEMNPPKAVRIVIIVGILALMTFVAVTFLVPFMAGSSLNNAIVWVVRLLAVGALLGLAVYLKRCGQPEGSSSRLFVEMMYKKYRSRPIYLIIFGLAFGFMLSGLAVAILGQPLPVHYSVPFFFVFIGVGAVIGDLIGRKLDYRCPLLP